MVYPVYVKNYPTPDFDKREILRYAGVKGDISAINALIDECIKELDGKLNYKVCYSEYPVKILGDKIDLTFTTIVSKDLAKNLKNCNRFILFAATVGIGIDRLIAKYIALSPTKALIFQAIGAERIESLCDLFNNEMKEKYKTVKPRFSAGYGDLPIEIQKDIFIALNCSKNIGVTLNESLLMSPSKSVTAIIGIANDSDCTDKNGCTACNKTECEFRRENEN
ncbi:MAG: Vitamin B12 dependent methionine synthase activation subunit [Clostridia bacterium]|nr:Vitamin B12 dependent methionine synthase activation subunit [Clostridia bacterium]